jgi:hypothetical protein
VVSSVGLFTRLNNLLRIGRREKRLRRAAALNAHGIHRIEQVMTDNALVYRCPPLVRSSSTSVAIARSPVATDFRRRSCTSEGRRRSRRASILERVDRGVEDAVAVDVVAQ